MGLSYIKALAVIESCTTVQQAKAAINYAQLFMLKYGVSNLSEELDKKSWIKLHTLSK